MVFLEFSGISGYINIMKEVLKFVVIDVIVLGREDISLNLDFMV